MGMIYYSGSRSGQKLHATSAIREYGFSIIKALGRGERAADLDESITKKQHSAESYRRIGLESICPTILANHSNATPVHPLYDRYLTLIERSRAMTFPDIYVYYGDNISITRQLGNSVPPFLSFQLGEAIAKHFGNTGVFVDLFSGAGGFGYGLKESGHQPLLACDVDNEACKTYKKNVGGCVLTADLASRDGHEVVKQEFAQLKKDLAENKPLILVGGTPCQGHSTMRVRKTTHDLDDDRNKRIEDYMNLVQYISPDCFILENVMAIRGNNTTETGKLAAKQFSTAINDLKFNGLYEVDVKSVLCSQYGVPQDRPRIIVIGLKKTGRHSNRFIFPEAITKGGRAKGAKYSLELRAPDHLPESTQSFITADNILSDLLPLEHPEGRVVSCKKKDLYLNADLHNPTLLQQYYQGGISMRQCIDTIRQASKKQPLQINRKLYFRTSA